MATCFEVVNGIFQPTETPIDTCTGHVLMTPTEYKNFESFNLLTSIDYDASLLAFRGAFGLILLCWFVSFGYAKVIEEFN